MRVCVCERFRCTYRGHDDIRGDSVLRGLCLRGLWKGLKKGGREGRREGLRWSKEGGRGMLKRNKEGGREGKGGRV